MHSPRRDAPVLILAAIRSPVIGECLELHPAVSPHDAGVLGPMSNTNT